MVERVGATAAGTPSRAELATSNAWRLPVQPVVLRELDGRQHARRRVGLGHEHRAELVAREGLVEG